MPAVNDEVEKVATPLLFKVIGEPRSAPPSLNCTVPVGVPAPEATIAVKVTLWPKSDGFSDDDTAVVTLTHVDYRSAAFHDMAAINEAAHDAGALTVWDLSHSAGAIAVDLNGAGCDLAVGCGYKYLNGGPGAPAYIYVAERLQDELQSPVQGWMGHADPFAFDDDYRPARGIDRFLTGTPSILALAALDAGLDTFDGVAMSDVEVKSRQLSQLFIDEVEARCGDEVRLASPGEPDQRGSHVVFAHANGYAVMQALIARGVIGDFRAPALMRFGFTPLYTRFADAWRAAEILAQILASREWDQPRIDERRQMECLGEQLARSENHVDPVVESMRQRGQKLLQRTLLELAIGVEAVVGDVAEVSFRLLHHRHVEEHAGLADLMVGAKSADAAW